MAKLVVFSSACISFMVGASYIFKSYLYSKGLLPYYKQYLLTFEKILRNYLKQSISLDNMQQIEKFPSCWQNSVKRASLDIQSLRVWSSWSDRKGLMNVPGILKGAIGPVCVSGGLSWMMWQ